MDPVTVTALADQLKSWSWSDDSKHPKDRLTDHQALDIAIRMLRGEQAAGSTGFITDAEGVRHRKIGE